MKIRQNFTVLNTLLSLMLGFGFSSAGLASPSTSHASTAVSAKRDKGIPASIYIRAFQKANKAWPGNTDSVLGHKTPIDAAAWGAIPELGSAHLLNSFITARQARPLKDYQGQTRRASWLYPDDGCFVRATVVDKILREQFAVEQSAKIFIFGNLNVKTANSPDGEVSWWYHVAAITKVKTATSEDYYVYDPAISFDSPLPVKDWIVAMQDPHAEIAICSGAAYDPGSDCKANGENVYSRTNQKAENAAPYYLDQEWDRLVELGRDPKAELF